MPPLSPRSLPLTTQQLEYLVAIDRADTWADAATAVGVSPSALSQGIAELERRLGVALFERDGRRRVPAPDHAEVLRYAEQVVAATDDLARWVARRRGGATGTIRLGLIDAAATHHFRAALRGFRDDHPEVDIHLTVGPPGGLLRSLRRSELDLVGCVQPPETPPGIDVATVLDDPLAVLAPEGSIGTSPADWGPWVTFPSGSHTRHLVAEALRAAGSEFDVVAESHQPEVLREMVLLDLGWTVLPLAGLGSLEGLRVVEPELTSRRIVVARRSGAPPDPTRDALAAALRGQT